MTHCLNILMQIRNRIPCLTVKEAHYTADSLIADAVAEDGQEYTLEIKPKPKICKHINYVIFAGSEAKHCLNCGEVFS